MFVQIKAGIKAVHPVPGFVRDNRLATIISYWDRGLHFIAGRTSKYYANPNRNAIRRI
jgi:hypothetical protein